MYHYWDDPISLQQTIGEVGQLSQGGTLAVQLGCHALRRGYRATISTYNLQLFDPSWFRDEAVDLASKLTQQRAARLAAGGGESAEIERLKFATQSYLEFLDLGGEVQMPPFNEELIATSLEQGWPILCGLSATYLYRECRERVPADKDADRSSEPDDVGGQPVGHFVVLHGFDRGTRDLLVADPLFPNPLAASHNYRAPVADVITAILLGIVTYDANLLTIRPSPTAGSHSRLSVSTDRHAAPDRSPRVDPDAMPLQNQLPRTVGED